MNIDIKLRISFVIKNLINVKITLEILSLASYINSDLIHDKRRT